MNELPELAQLLLAHQSCFNIKIPNHLLFESNEVRKSSPYRGLCLTASDDQSTPLFIVKFPLKSTPIANAAIEAEYTAQLDVFQKYPGSVPQPYGMADTALGKMALYEYMPHQMLYQFLYDTDHLVETSLFEGPISWLVSWNQETAGHSITTPYLDSFSDHFFSQLHQTYPKLEPVLTQIWQMARPLVYPLADEGVPLVYMHGDFNALNIGLKKESQASQHSLDADWVIFDWEDAVSQAPIMFDFFYFVIVFYWYLLDARFTKLCAEDVNPNIDKIIDISLKYFDIYNKKFNLSLRSMNALFVLFLFHSIWIDIAEKRSSEEALVLRWVDMLVHLGGENFLTHHLDARRSFYSQTLPSQKDSHAS